MAQQCDEGTLVVEPIIIQQPLGPEFSVHLFGKPVNMSLKTNPEAAQLASDYGRRIGVRKIWAPVADFSGRICEQAELDTRAPTFFGVPVMRGVLADGCEVGQSEAYYVASGDCPTIIAFHPGSGRLIAAHAGRESLWDRNHVHNGADKRKHESVVDAIMECFEDVSENELRIFMCCGIAPRHFIHKLDDPQHANINLKMVDAFEGRIGVSDLIFDEETGALDLGMIIRAQFAEYGVTAIGNDLIDTYGDRNADNSDRWWSNARGDRNERNGVLVVNNT